MTPRQRRAGVARLLTLALVALVLVPARAEARPPEPRINAPHWCEDSTGPLPNLKRTTHFAIWYDTVGGGLTINQYVNVLEHVWATEISSFGWAAPPSYTARPAPGGRYPVRLDAIGDYGFVSGSGAHAGPVGDNPSTGWNEGDAQASCMVLNRDFSTLVATPLQGLQVTVAHEFFHSITRGLGVTTDLDRSYREGGATWMEDEVYDAVNDNYQYLWPLWGESMGAFPDDPSDSAYGYWFVWRGLTEQYGTGVPGGAEDVMQRLLEAVSKGKKQMPATERAFLAEHTYLLYAYHQFAVAARFMKPCGGGYVEPLCFEEAAGYQVDHSASFAIDGTVTPTQGYTGEVRDDYALNWVKLPGTPKHYPINFKNLSSGSPLFWSIACDTGTSLQLDMWGPIEPGKTGNLGVDRSACTGPMYLTVTNEHVSAPNPVTSPKASYKVWVPYAKMEGTVSWTVTGSANGSEDNGSTWSESWSESGSFALKLKRDPLHVADYLVVDDGSGYTINVSRDRTYEDAANGCTSITSGSGSGAGSPTSAGFLGSSFPNLDPPDPVDDYPDLLGLLAGMPLTYAETYSGSCGSGSSGPIEGSGPYYHGLASIPPCAPAALAGQETYTDGWAFVGAWNDSQKKFLFSCSATLPVAGGSQTISVSGSVGYPALP